MMDIQVHTLLQVTGKLRRGRGVKDVVIENVTT